MGKGSSNSGAGAPQQSSINTYDTSVPTYAQPYVNNMLGAVQGQLYNTDASGQATGLKAYQPYSTNPSDYFAPFSPLQQQAQQNAANMQVAPQLGQAADYTNQAAQGALDSANIAYGYGAQGQASGLQGQQLGIEGGGKYGSMGAGYGQQGANIGTAGGAYYGGQGMGYGAQGAGLAGTNLGIGALGTQQGLSYGQNAQNPYAVQSYMNPYLQASLAPAQQLLNQQYDMQGAAEQGAATSKGAFGGSREALMQGLNQQNRMLAQNQLVGNAYNQAYNTANQNMQAAAQLGMQGAGVGLQGLQGANTAYGTGIAGANTGLQGVNTQLAGTAQGMQGAQVGLAGVDRQLAGTAQGMQGAQIGLQGVNAAQAGYGLAGQQGQNLANIGQTQYGQQMGINNLQNQIGAQQTAAQQAIINQAVQNYTNQQQYPYMQLGFANNMLRGLPMSSQTVSNYVGVPNPYTQAISGIGTLATAPGLFNDSQQTNAEGGLLETKKMASGGITQAYDVGGAVRADLYQMSPQELKQYMQESSSPEAKRMAQEILNEKMPQRMVSGGIAAVKRYAKGTPENEAGASESGGDSAGEKEAQAALRRKKAGIPDTLFGIDLTQTPTATPAEERLIPKAWESLTNIMPKGLRKIQESQTVPVETPPAPVAAQQGITAVPTPTAPAVNPAASTIGPGGIPLNVGTSPVVPQTAPTSTQTVPVATQTVPAATQTVLADKTGIAGVGNVGTDDFMSNMMARLGITKPESQEEYLARREKAVGPDTVTAAQRERIMSERNTQREEMARLKQIRQAEFFANLGTKTGPTLMAISSAMKETLPKLVEDDKMQGEMRRKLNDAMYNLDHAERAEKIGNFDAYEKYKADSVKQITEVGKMATEVYREKLRGQATISAASLREKGENTRAQQRATHETNLEKYRSSEIERKQKDADERDYLTSSRNFQQAQQKLADVRRSKEYIELKKEAGQNNPDKKPYIQNQIDTAKAALDEIERPYLENISTLKRDSLYYGRKSGRIKDDSEKDDAGIDLSQFNYKK
jgi:hypothetical protein